MFCRSTTRPLSSPGSDGEHRSTVGLCAVIIRDDNGVILQSNSVALAALGHNRSISPRVFQSRRSAGGL